MVPCGGHCLALLHYLFSVAYIRFSQSSFMQEAEQKGVNPPPVGELAETK